MVKCHIMDINMAVIVQTITTIMDHTGYHHQIGSLLINHLYKVSKETMQYWFTFRFKFRD
jgi:hypothetical protein